MERFSGKVAAVTGSSGGIGTEICKQLIRYGVTVVGLEINSEYLEKQAQELSVESGKGSGKFYPLKCDVTNESDIEKSFQWITSELGPISILINGAGVLRTSFLTDVTGEEISKVFDINVKSAILCSKYAIKNMIDNSIDGHIVNLCSIAGHYVLGTSAQASKFQIYASSKHALKVISEGLRRELISKNTDIKVTNLSPGPVRTELWTGNADTESLSSKEILEPKNVADACIYVLNTPPNVLVSELTVLPIHQKKL